MGMFTGGRKLAPRARYVENVRQILSLDEARVVQRNVSERGGCKTLNIRRGEQPRWEENVLHLYQ